MKNSRFIWVVISLAALALSPLIVIFLGASSLIMPSYHEIQET